MLRHHLPQFVSHLGLAGRYLVSYCHAAIRAVVVALSRFESPRAAFHAAWRQTQSLRDVAPVRRVRRGLPLLIHYHIFKNAGTSFEWALQQAFGSGLLQCESPSQGGLVSPEDLARFAQRNPEAQAIVSHQAVPPAPHIRGRRVMTSILLRDPIARIRSIYAFERQQVSDSRGARQAKELDFNGYVQWRLEVSPRMFCNFQVHFCVRTAEKNSGPADQADLEKAIRLLDDIDIVGTVQRYEEWLSLAESVLAESFADISLTSVRHNQTSVGPSRSEAEILEHLVTDLGEELAHRLLDENELDMRLHQVADALLTRRLAERPISIKLREAYRQGRHTLAESSLPRTESSGDTARWR